MSDLPQHVEHGFQDRDGTYQWVRGQPTNPQGDNVTTVYRAYSPSQNRSGTTYTDHTRAQSQAAVRNQFVDCDPNADQPADWIVQTGHVRWENP